MKCRRCKAPAVVEVRRHNAAFCGDCFLRHVREQVKRAIAPVRHVRAVRPDPGGGVRRQGLAGAVGRAARARLPRRRASTSGSASAGTRTGRTRWPESFAAERDADLVEVDLARDYGFDVPTAGKKGSRSTCAVCGLSKRYVFNRAALEGGYRRDRDRPQPRRRGRHAAGQHAPLADRVHRAPDSRCLPAQGRLRPARSSRSYRLSRAGDRGLRVPAGDRLRGRGVPARGREHAAPVQGRDERRSSRRRRGRRRSSSSGYLDRGRPLFATHDDVRARRRANACGQPTTGRFCAFCRARAQILGERLDEPRGGDDPRATMAELVERGHAREIYGGATVIGPFEAGEPCCSSISATGRTCSPCRPAGPAHPRRRACRTTC